MNVTRTDLFYARIDEGRVHAESSEKAILQHLFYVRVSSPYLGHLLQNSRTRSVLPVSHTD